MSIPGTVIKYCLTVYAWVYFLGSQFCFAGIFVCFYAITIHFLIIVALKHILKIESVMSPIWIVLVSL